MKTFKLLFLIGFLVAFVAGCTTVNDPISEDELTLKSAQPVMVEVPIKVDLTVWDHSDYTDERCGGFPNFFLTMIGDGNISHLGKINTVMTFCCDVTTGVYQNTEVVFVAANGDELYAEIPIGYILPNEGDNSDFYQSFFNDPMYFTGGTGRFENASGEAMTNAFVHDPTGPEDVWHTDFFSEGTLVLVKGNR